MKVVPGIDPARVPKHVACVMDGNGRWAQQRGLKRTDGHAAGEEALLQSIYAAQDVGVEWLTVYAFSTENWKRPISEVRFLMRLNEMILIRRLDELNERGIRIRFLGRQDHRVPGRLLREFNRAAEVTKDNKSLTLTFAFNYGGRAELIDAMKRMIDDGVSSSSIDEKQVRRYLYHPDMPDPDLVVRTSGEYRISNFLLWELAYSELVFTDVLWPDFSADHLYDAIRTFQERDRRFGKINTSGLKPRRARAKVAATT
ncbi:MAG: undecaprenyl diphosphate synthase [Acidimicrobiales bacterium]|nr:undecaprenyl diphosphate synthase [Acidimicrobiales bacterium]